HPDHPHVVVADGRCRAGHVRSVSVEVHRRRVVLHEVPARDVVDEAVTVVVDAVAGNLPGVAPDVGGEVRMTRRDGGVDHRHHRPAAVREVPSLFGIARVKTPQVLVALPPRTGAREVGIVGGEGGLHDVVGLRVHHLGIGGVARCGGGDVGAGGQVEDVDVCNVGGGPSPRGAGRAGPG